MNEQLEVPTITIDGTIHELSTLTDEQMQLVHHCKVADSEMARLQDLMAIISTGRQQYINELGKQLNTEAEQLKGNSIDNNV